MSPRDEVLVQQACSGDPQAFGQLVDRYQGAVYGLAYHLVGNANDAQDLAQEALLQAYLMLSQLQDPAKFPHWLQRITANVCKMWLRRSQPKMLPWDALDVPPTYSPVERACEQKELRSVVQTAIDHLSEKSRLAVTLYYIDGLTQREISDFLDTSVGAIKNRLHEARKQLQKELMKRGFAPEPSMTMVKESIHSDRLPDDFTRRVQKMLQDADALVRRKALHELQEHHPQDQSVEDLIISAVNDPDADVRQKAIQALGWIRSEKAVPVVALALQGSDFEVRKRAQWTLNRIGTEEVISQVFPLFQHTDPVVRRGAADALKGICPATEVQRLCGILRTDADPAVRRGVADALKGICSATEVPRLYEILQTDTDLGVRERLVDVLVSSESPAVPSILVELLSGTEQRLRRKAMDVLRSSKPQAIGPELIRLLDSDNIDLQRRSIELLGLMEYRDAEVQLIAKLDSPEAETIALAANALGQMRSELAAKPLIQYLWNKLADLESARQSPKGFALRWGAAISTLGVIGDSKAVPVLLAYWERLLELRASAKVTIQHSLETVVGALGSLGDSRAVQPLTQYLEANADVPHTSQREDWQGRWVAHREIVKALGEIGDPVAVPSIAQITHASYFIGEESVWALANLGTAAIPTLCAILDQVESEVTLWNEKRWRAAESLGKIGDATALGSLVCALRDEERSVRYYAAQALGNLRDPRAIAPLHEAILNDRDGGVRKAAFNSLRNLGIPEDELPTLPKPAGKRKPRKQRIKPEQFQGGSPYSHGLRLPARDGERRVLLKKLLDEQFEKGRTYTEQEVNTTIHRVYEDHCTVRRYFVDYGMMSRSEGIYRVV